MASRRDLVEWEFPRRGKIEEGETLPIDAEMPHELVAEELRCWILTSETRTMGDFEAMSNP